MKKTFDIRKCSACSGDHEDLKAEKLSGGDGNNWQVKCPETKVLVLVHETMEEGNFEDVHKIADTYEEVDGKLVPVQKPSPEEENG